MSTLAEIESAIAKLPPEEVAALRAWLDTLGPTHSALEKWRGKGTGLVKELGGVDAFLREARANNSEADETASLLSDPERRERILRAAADIEAGRNVIVPDQNQFR